MCRKKFLSYENDKCLAISSFNILSHQPLLWPSSNFSLRINCRVHSHYCWGICAQNADLDDERSTSYCLCNLPLHWYSRTGQCSPSIRVSWLVIKKISCSRRGHSFDWGRAELILLYGLFQRAAHKDSLGLPMAPGVHWKKIMQAQFSFETHQCERGHREQSIFPDFQTNCERKPSSLHIVDMS